MSGSLLNEESASPSASPPTCSHLCFSLSLSKKYNLKKGFIFQVVDLQFFFFFCFFLAFIFFSWNFSLQNHLKWRLLLLVFCAHSPSLTHSAHRSRGPRARAKGYTTVGALQTWPGGPSASSHLPGLRVSWKHWPQTAVATFFKSPVQLGKLQPSGPPSQLVHPESLFEHRS